MLFGVMLRQVGIQTKRHLSKLATCSVGTKDVTFNSKAVQVLWKDDSTTDYPNVFLRDCCQCDQCFNHSTQQRQLETCSQVPIDVQPVGVNLTSGDVKINWSDGHTSSYTHDFLTERRQYNPDISHTKPQVWNELREIPCFDFTEWLTNENVRLEWLESILRVGLTLLTGAKEKPGELEKIKPLVGGYFKNTHYGDVFEVASKASPSSLAYTSDKILPHMDLPHLKYSPGLQVLHCIEQAKGEGGDSTFIDGFYIAQQFRRDYPRDFHVLSTFDVTFRDRGSDVYGEFETFYERSIIGVNKGGEVDSIFYSNWLRDTTMKGTIDEVQAFYEAYYRLHEYINKQNSIAYKMAQGDIAIFNNLRMLHGRTAYSSHTSRYLQGCYIDWDQIFFKLRPVKRRLVENRN